MNSVELVKQICKERNIPVSKLERECGFSNGYIRSLKRGMFPYEKMKAISLYLDIPIERLVTEESVQENVTQEWYANPETAKLAQSMFEDSDMRALFHMKRTMEPEKFKAHMDMMKQLYKLEHPEEFPEDF